MSGGTSPMNPRGGGPAPRSAGEPRPDRRSIPEARFRPLPVDRSPARRIPAYVAPALRDVAWVPTEPPVIERMFEMAQLAPGDVIYDMGCGDGRIIIEAALRHGCRGVGIDIDPNRIAQCHAEARRAKVEHLVEFREANLFEADVSLATVVTLYLLPGLNARLRPRLMSQLRPGTRIISNHFDMGDWEPDEKDTVGWRKIFRWVVPAWIDGQWKCIIGSDEARQRMILNLHRNYQHVSGGAIVDGRRIHLKQGRINGDLLSFTLNRMVAHNAATQFIAKVEGKQLRGTCRVDGQPDSHRVWGGARE